MEVDVLIPAYNEAGMVGKTITALKALPGLQQIIVVDDGSTDGTAEEAEQAGARLVRMDKNSGKGAAVLAGAKHINAPLVALVDADLGDTAAEIVRLINPVEEGKAEMTIALFPAPAKGGGLGFVKRMAAWSIRRCSGLEFKEPLSGQRVFRRELLERLCFAPRGFGLEVALTLDLLKHGHTILEVETQMRHRERGRDAASCLHRGRQFAAVIRELWLRRQLLLKGGAR